MSLVVGALEPLVEAVLRVPPIQLLMSSSPNRQCEPAPLAELGLLLEIPAGSLIIHHLTGMPHRLRPRLRKMCSSDASAQVESNTACHARRFISSRFACSCSGFHVLPRPLLSSYSTLKKSSGRLPNINSKGEAPWSDTMPEKPLHTNEASSWKYVEGGTSVCLATSGSSG